MDVKIENELKLIKFIQPIIEIIIKDIINSRIKDINDKDIKDSKNSFISDNNAINNKLKDLNQIKITKDSKDFILYEINIYFYYKKESIIFIVEHWKFKIDTTESQHNELNEVIKKRIKKKLLTFYRSIKSLEILLPLNSLVKKSFDYSFQYNLYQASDIQMTSDETIKNEKKRIKLETKDEKFGSIQLFLNYFTIDGIYTYEQKLKEIIDYNKIYTEIYSKISMSKTGKSKLTNNLLSTNYNNSDKIKENENENESDIILSNDSLSVPNEEEDDELKFSSIILPKIIEKNGNINESDIEEIKKGKNNENINLDKLYSSCLDEDVENLNCRKNLDDILRLDNLINKENKELNEIKDKYNLYFGNNKMLVNELYEEMKEFEFSDLIMYQSKNNKKKNKYKDIINDYLDIKKLLV